MPDNLKKTGGRDRKRISKQKHEVAYQKRKRKAKLKTKSKKKK